MSNFNFEPLLYLMCLLLQLEQKVNLFLVNVSSSQRRFHKRLLTHLLFRAPFFIQSTELLLLFDGHFELVGYLIAHGNRQLIPQDLRCRKRLVHSCSISVRMGPMLLREFRLKSHIFRIILYTMRGSPYLLYWSIIQARGPHILLLFLLLLKLAVVHKHQIKLFFELDFGLEFIYSRIASALYAQPCLSVCFIKLHRCHHLLLLLLLFRSPAQRKWPISRIWRRHICPIIRWRYRLIFRLKWGFLFVHFKIYITIITQSTKGITMINFGRV